jgi:hypothetical protein
MRHILALSLFLAAALPCHAQGEKDKPKPNTLTAKEIADGWILLFDGETTFGCSIEGGAKVADGVLLLGGDKKSSVRTTTEFQDYSVKFEGLHSSEKLAFHPGFDGRGRTHLHNYATFSPVGSRFWYTGHLKVSGSDGTENSFYWKRGSSGGGTPGKVMLEPWGASRIVLTTDPDLQVSLRTIKLRPLNLIPLFNGKDLDGWKEFPGKKSKVTVENGEINIKNGPGDLQTVGKYKDFVLQLECKSNGKHLNSGIFFRCKDGEYQNGYEAQIHNKFLATPKKYQIEEYDSKTNKLIGKKEMEFTAADYGTGAIYRRMPARKEVAKDGEWFTMTIVAHGNHIATWVNGVQVVDWTDNRPKHDNPRNGCRLEAGHISIQGHDPTTDLSFRNIRIAELK